MGMFDQFKQASEMLKGMSPDQVQQLMKQAQDSKKMMEEMVKKIVEEEIKKRDLVTRSEVAEIVRKESKN
jgi:hypothetical protein